MGLSPPTCLSPLDVASSLTRRLVPPAGWRCQPARRKLLTLLAPSLQPSTFNLQPIKHHRKSTQTFTEPASWRIPGAWPRRPRYAKHICAAAATPLTAIIFSASFVMRAATAVRLIATVKRSILSPTTMRRCFKWLSWPTKMAIPPPLAPSNAAPNESLRMTLNKLNELNRFEGTRAGEGQRLNLYNLFNPLNLFNSFNPFSRA